MSSMIGQRGLKGSTGSAANQKPGGYDVAQLQQFTPEQMQLFQQLFSHVSPNSYTSRLASGDQSLFNEVEAPALKQFAGIQGGLASRFSGMGSMGSRKSSGFQNTSNQAASDFAGQLQSRRQELQQQAIRDLMGFGDTLLGQRPYQQFLQEPETPFWQKLLSGALPLAGAAAGGIFGGPAGAAIGGRAGSAAGQAFF